MFAFAAYIFSSCAGIFSNYHLVIIRHQFAIHYLIWVYCDAGSLNEAKILMDELELRSKSGFITGIYLGLSAAWMNDMEKAFLYLEKGFADRDSIMLTLKQAPHVPDKVRKDPRFQDLLDRVGFPRN
jgi:hypothetical protein